MSHIATCLRADSRMTAIANVGIAYWKQEIREVTIGKTVKLEQRKNSQRQS